MSRITVRRSVPGGTVKNGAQRRAESDDILGRKHDHPTGPCSDIARDDGNSGLLRLANAQRVPVRTSWAEKNDVVPEGWKKRMTEGNADTLSNPSPPQALFQTRKMSTRHWPHRTFCNKDRELQVRLLRDQAGQCLDREVESVEVLASSKKTNTVRRDNKGLTRLEERFQRLLVGLEFQIVGL